MKRSHLPDTKYDSMYTKVALVERNTSPGGVSLVNANKTAKKGHNDIVELAMEIQKADNFIHATACTKLQVIAQQVRFLQEQAKQVLVDTKTHLNLHHAACNFVKVPGNIYHLYKRNSGQHYFSMLSTDEWNSPHEFIGSYRLEYDQSWTPAKNIDDKDNELSLIHKILKSDQPISYALQDTPMDI